ncbi:SCO2195 family GlnR-regulated protein [Streptomyces sp. TRM 70351]|uniref:SCO2195 family GlnR-regulated protein n=1 Tax=Streptomyces sp. TRM 70351 TaxID=3116552 RepID=UPI003FCD2D7B
MQAADAPRTPVRQGRPVDHVTVTAARPSLSDALRALETVLLRGGHSTARRNAWTSVLEDRRRARDRLEVAHVLQAAAEGTRRAT